MKILAIPSGAALPYERTLSNTVTSTGNYVPVPLVTAGVDLLASSRY